MAPSNLDKAVTERDALAATVLWLEGKVKVVPPSTPLDAVEVEMYIGELTNLREKVVANYDKIVACVPADMDPHDVGYQRLMDKVMDLLKILLRAKATTVAAAVPLPQPQVVTRSSTPQIRLPRIELPEFGGDLHEWMSFKDLFVATIASNTELSNVQKLAYLRPCLCGDAANILSSMDLVDANYDIGWKMLVERYENVREIFYSLLQRFMNHPSVSGDVSESLRSLADITKQTKRCLQSLKVPVEHWDGIFVFLLLGKLDETSRSFWELSLQNTSIPVLDEFLAFLEQRARALAGGSSFKSHKPSSVQAKKAYVHHAKTKPSTSRNPVPESNHQERCKLCYKPHALENCSKFAEMSVNDRITAVRGNHLCFTCLKPGHPAVSCDSKVVCEKCKRNHHSLLHNGQSTFNGHVSHGSSVNQTILATAQVNVQCKSGSSITCKAFLDGGSTSSFITEACVSRLGLSRKRITADIVGIASSSIGTAKGMVTLTFYSRVGFNEFSVEAFILPKVTGRLPSYPCDATSWTHLNNLELADPTYNQPSTIDILLGADIFYDLLINGKRNGPRGAPVALRSKLGWLVAGSAASRVSPEIMSHHSQHALVDAGVNEIVEKFWQLEAVPETRVYTVEEESCETHFKDTHSRRPCGRYVVEIPLKSPSVPVGKTHDIAVRRMLSIERRLKSLPEVKSLYADFMHEYETLGHMRQFTPEEAEHPENFGFLPHHFVLKDPSQISKFRTVFDGSVTTGSGFSLNDSQMIGPQIQKPLVSILMRFRLKPIAFTADISKMFRQFLVSPEHQNLQCIVWRDDPKKPLQYYKLLTVTYGTASGPFLACRALQQLALDEGHELSLATPVVLEDFYVDDCMSGSTTVSNAQKTILQLMEMMKRGGLSLRKWSSNSKQVLAVVPPELRETQTILPVQEDEVVKTLGLYWNTATDQFSFKVKLPPVRTKYTKRVVLSEISMTFDPLGWLAPTIILVKILIQDMWKLELDWDEPLPPNLQELWSEYRSNLTLLENIVINRCVIPVAGSTVQLHGFCDASEKAYAAVLYLRTVSPDGKVTVSLLTSKTKVAPAKTISIPRLELCAAHLLSMLVKAVKGFLNIPLQEVRVWSDSTIVLSWLSSPPHRLTGADKIFVANRVTKIQELLPMHHWGHVRSTENSADCASRGLNPNELVAYDLWWNRPSWLSASVPAPCDPIIIAAPDLNVSLEQEVIINAHVHVSNLSLVENCSSMSKLKRVMAWCLRFARNLREVVKKKKDSSYAMKISTGVLTVPEHRRAVTSLIRGVQMSEFPKEYKLLSKNKTVPMNSNLLSLSPFLDDSLIMRVGGRLRHAKINVDRKHPVLLPRHHHLTRLIIDETHKINLHAGPQLILSILQGQFWIVGSRDAVRQQVKKCVTCARHKATTAYQMMADLPSARVNPSRPFSKCGVDYAGPFDMRPILARSKLTIKAYLALFICFATRAVHLEVVSSLSTDAFILAFKRFVARRGKPSDMFSDCGTNFVGANKELAELLTLVKSDAHNQKIADFLSLDGIQWHFNPPSAPHFGGLWEAGVKSVKFHLRRVVGTARLTFEELSTVVAQIEACLNSRPLTSMSSDPNDLQAITPAHFLIGDSLRALPEPDLTDIPINRLSRFQLVQQLTQHFWRRWSNEFLARLQQRTKWLLPRRDIRLGDLVLMKTDGVPPTCWPLARVIKLHPSDDKMVRSVTVKTATGELKRPIVKLCLLPMEDNKTNALNQNQDEDVL